MSETQERAYLDYAATTPLDPRVLEAMMPHLSESFGNASALYAEGKEAARAVEAARRTVAQSIGARNPYEIVFTSGGTESDNTAVRGLALAARDARGTSKGPGHVVCSSYEHKAVLEAVASLRRDGFEVSEVSPREDGVVYPEDLEGVLRPDTVLVSVMTANNEIGTVNPIGGLAEAAHAAGALFHTDAVAAVGKVPFEVEELGVDAASLTAHKVCGPKGAGALYVSRKARLRPLIVGGGQEKGRRSGTYATHLITGLAKALEIACGDGLGREAARLAGMRDGLVSRISSECPAVLFPAAPGAGDVSGHLPGLVPMIVEGWESETLVMRLDDLGFAVSGGSACNAATAKASHVLRAIGISGREASGFLRVSFGRFTEQGELDRLAGALAGLVSKG